MSGASVEMSASFVGSMCVVEAPSSVSELSLWVSVSSCDELPVVCWVVRFVVALSDVVHVFSICLMVSARIISPMSVCLGERFRGAGGVARIGLLGVDI